MMTEANLTLKKTDEICRASESTAPQMKVVEHNTEEVNVVRPKGDNGSTKEIHLRGHQTRVEIVVECMGQKTALLGARGCTSCGKLNHFASICRNSKRRGVKSPPTMKAVEEYESDEELYCVSGVAALRLDDTQLVTLRLESGNWVRFQPDTGAQCNAIPLKLYMKAHKDFQKRKVKPSNSTIYSGGSRLPVLGQATFCVWRDNTKWVLECKLVDSLDIRPILGQNCMFGHGSPGIP